MSKEKTLEVEKEEDLSVSGEKPEANEKAKEEKPEKAKKKSRFKVYFDENKRTSFEPYAAIVLLLYLIHPFMNILFQIFYWVQKKYLWSFNADYILISTVLAGLFCFIGIMLLSEQYMNHKRAPEKYPGAVRTVFRKEAYAPLIMFLILAAWELIATFVTGADWQAFFENEYAKYGYVAYLLSYFLWFGCAVAIRSDKIRVTLFKISVWCAAIDVVWAILWSIFLNLDIDSKEYKTIVETFDITTGCLHREKFWKFTGGFNNQNHFGYYICLMAIICAGLIVYEKTLKQKIIYSVLLGIITFGVVACDTMGAWLAAFFGFILLIIGVKLVNGKFSKWTLIAFLIFWAVSFISDIWLQHLSPSIIQLFKDILGIAADPGHSDMAGTKRWGLWKKSFTVLIPNSPIFGYGIIKYIGNDAYTINNSPHNEVIEYGLTYGVPAMCLYTFIVLFIFFRDLKTRKSLSNGAFVAMCGAFTYFVSSMFGVLFLYTAPFFFIFLGLGISDKEYPDGVLPAPEPAINKELIDAEIKKQMEKYKKK